VDWLRDKNIVVVGGTSGLGLSGARAILSAGGRVVVVGLESVELGAEVPVIVGDACNSSTVERAIEAAVSRWGRLDGLYHVAGGSGRSKGDGRLHEVSDAGWEYTIRLNLTSMFLSNRAAVRQFLKQKPEARSQKPEGGGVVLNMGSVLGWAPSAKHFSTFAYAAAKSAVVGMTKSAAACYAGENIRFNVIAPALVDTPMARRAVADQEIMSFVRSKQPLDGGRIGRAEDLDGAVVYLLSDQARFVTGQVLAVDGGWAVSEGEELK
jgi:NAD(P)-dependent dehydrogenase (short-subunit alcohol dehydrogenase family)